MNPNKECREMAINVDGTLLLCGSRNSLKSGRSQNDDLSLLTVPMRPGTSYSACPRQIR
ncbi:MAG: hypothetical protein K0S79_2794 [Nitrospira sp.]|jgi:hypothetical protein|nr:hypothetical protein [Nitrospira sp.]